jgi:hypothetical protein
MRHVKLEPEVVRELVRDRQHLELRDEQERTIGYFVPADMYVEMSPRPATNEEYQRALAEVSVEENARRLKKAGMPLQRPDQLQ